MSDFFDSALRNWSSVWNTAHNDAATRWFSDTMSTTSAAWEVSAPGLGSAIRAQGHFMGDTPLARNFFMAPEVLAMQQPRLADFTLLPCSVADPSGELGSTLESLGVVSFSVLGAVTASWPTALGGQTFQFGHWLFNPSSKEIYLYWWTSPVASSADLPDNDATRIAMIAAIPLALQTATYLAENLFPQVPAMMPRLLQIAGTSPSPAARAFAGGPLVVRERYDSPVFGVVAPIRIDLGYLIPWTTELDSRASSLSFAIASLSRVVSIFEDGFVNYAGTDLSVGNLFYDQPELVPGPQHWFTPSLLNVHAAALPTLTLTP